MTFPSSTTEELADVREAAVSPGRDLHSFRSNLGHGSYRGVVFALNTAILVPVLLHRLGKEQFALLALATPFMRYGFNGVFDGGIGTGTIRFISREFARGDKEEVNRYISTSVLIYVMSMSLLFGLYYFLAPSLVPLVVGKDPSLYLVAKSFFGEAMGVYCLFLLSNPFFALFMGVQRVHLTHIVGTVVLLGELFGIVVMIPFGLTLQRIAWVYGLNAALGLVLCVSFGRWAFPSLRVGLRYVSRGCLKDLLGYGGRYSITVTTTLLNPVLDKLILARFVGLAEVAFYEAATRLMEVLKRLTQLVLLPIFPLAGAKQMAGRLSLQNLYRRVFSLNLMLSIGLYLIPATFAFEVFQAWLGPGSNLAATAFIFLAVTALSLALVGPATLMLAGMGELKPLVITGLISLGVNIAVSPLLAKAYGFTGLLIGTVMGYAVLNVLALGFLLRGRTEFAISWDQTLRSAALGVCGAVLPGCALSALLGKLPMHSGLLHLAVAGTVAAALYAGLTLIRADNRRILVRAFQSGRVLD